jgi:hypothetical protein
MLIGYVSDENYLALAQVAVEFARDGEIVAQATSSASGAIVSDLPPGEYRLTLARDGFGAKHLTVTLPVARPLRLRLLSDGLTGFMWPKWVRSGEPAELRVHSVAPYRAELFRYGLGKEPVELLGWFDEHGPRAMAQILPDDDVSQTGVRFNTVGFTSPGHVRRIAGPQRSGLYYLHVRNERGEFFSFPWVVAPATPREPIAVLAATNNWNAYNRFGGRSNYINEAGLPPTPAVNARQDLARYRIGNKATQTAENHVYPPLSFERPEPDCFVGPEVEATDPMTGRLASSLAPGLWRLLAWLEREGYGYDVYSDAQLRSGELDLDAYRVLLTEMHPEYWYAGEYDAVRDWVQQRGGRLMYLGGNGADCEVEYVDAGRARYLTRQPNRDLPEEVHLESRFHRTHAPQAQLLGVTFTHAGEGTAAPYRVVDPDHWAFAGTGLAAGDLFGAASLHERVMGGASGHETDKRTPNTPDGFQVLARGTNPDDGGADMVYRDLPGRGGEVFSVGSITYIASLLVDEGASAVARNVLDRFVKS